MPCMRVSVDICRHVCPHTRKKVLVVALLTGGYHISGLAHFAPSQKAAYFLNMNTLIHMPGPGNTAYQTGLAMPYVMLGGHRL